ncbi:methyltransferase domain-containing protein [Pseudomonas sp. RGM2987]|uniref:methyltransferase domain-containing protein n=1 Tax=Pseudomonas sp. RGM2987 TaxID=2930090 RepID=UPI001FD63277|nr:methyltransferase domain-containing protein [Pseudomonas sp. RGM2987]MCJ8205240.1 methyltransferase domain-containing protein [Pseudomonas sp. RGM2987]
MKPENEPVWIDLGCGKRKQEGFIGIDRFPMPEVDILADIDAVLPLEDDSVDLLFSSHALEHTKDLMFTMREIYRVCKHGAQVCIIAPYYEQKLNVANPYHLTVFNEHTPRFWTDHPETPVDPLDYPDPVQRPWGLSKSDNSNPGLDIRLINVEFFYFPEYSHLPLEQKRKFRNERFNVCEQIMYQLIVWKGDERSPDASFSEYVDAFVPYEPYYIRHLKMHEQEQIIQKFTQSEAALRQRIEELKLELANRTPLAQGPDVAVERRINELTEDRAQSERLVHETRTENHHLRLQVMGLFEKTELLNNQLHESNIKLMKSELQNQLLNDKTLSLNEQNMRLQDEAAQSSAQLDELMQRLAHAQSAATQANHEVLALVRTNQELRDKLESLATIDARVALLKAELLTANGIIEWYRTKEGSWKSEQSRLSQELTSARQASQIQSPLAQEVKHLKLALSNAQQHADHSRHEALQVIDNLQTEVSGYRASRSLQLVSLYKSKGSLWDSISPAFSSLRDFTKKHLLNTSRPMLALGDDLRNVPYREYLMPIKQDNLRRITLAIRPLMRGNQGLVGIEIVSSDKAVVAQVALPLAVVNPDAPTHFELPAATTLEKNWYLRIFVKDSDVPVGLYEVSEYSLIRKRYKYFPFAALQ